ncbi:MAG TPA: SIS domain-containing protein [Vicinamibacterales bacterium]|nr:SIS domain-containing protein [Vicinamibacterales bacterium]
MALDPGTKPTGYFSTFARLFDQLEITTRDGGTLPLDEGMAAAIALVLSIKGGRGKAMVIGNGGSAAIASHLHNDLTKAVGVRAMIFNEPPLLTALANDDGYHTVFHTPLKLWAERDDLLIAVSSSGESRSIVDAAALCAERGCRVLTFSGFKPSNRLRQLGDVNIYVPSPEYGYVEMAHSVIGHCMTDLAIMHMAAAHA